MQETWELAIKIGLNKETSEKKLKELGFRIVGKDKLCYECVPPQGWTKNDSSTEFFDAQGKPRILQFRKRAFYDSDAQLNFI